MNSNEIDPRCLIRAQGLSRRTGEVLCVRDVSFKVDAGAMIAVVGSNGSGKTTLCDLVSGFVRPTSGSVSVRGRRSGGGGPQWFAKQGVLRLFQAPRAFEQMTVLDCLALAASTGRQPSLTDQTFWSLTQRKSAEEAARTAAVQILRRVGWTELSMHQARALSYGQRKLLAAMQLRLANGMIAVCDEPTAGLDGEKARMVFGMLGEWQHEARDRAVLVTTHDLEAATFAVGQTLRMEHGMLRREE